MTRRRPKRRAWSGFCKARDEHHPTAGTIIARDPDIPLNRQRVSWRAEGACLRGMWRSS